MPCLGPAPARPPQRFTDQSRRFVRRLGFPVPGFASIHILRHACATALAAKGTDPKTLQAVLGHHAASFTLDRYCRVSPQNLGAAGILSDQLFGSVFEGGTAAEKTGAGEV